MASGKFVAYYRVSTAKQGRSGLGLEAQRAATRDYLNGGAWELVGEYSEVESGKRDDRPQLQLAMDHCRLTGARLLIAKLDRLSRDPDFIGKLLKTGVQFTAVDMADANETMIRIMSVLAQAERKATGERTKAALAAAKARGVKLGTPGNLKNQREGSIAGNARKTANADEHARLVKPHIERAMSPTDGGEAPTLRVIADRLTKSKTPPPRRGSEWAPMQVKRVLDRLGLSGR